jgi:hypothetical protein
MKNAKHNALPFNFGKASGADYTLIPVGGYTGNIVEARFVTVKNTDEQRLWLRFVIAGPSQATRSVTTLCVLDDKAKSAYKTASLIEAVATHIGGYYLPADPATLIGAFVGADIVQWTPQNGNMTNDIRSFRKVESKNAVTEFVEEVASHFDIAQAEALAKKTEETQY